MLNPKTLAAIGGAVVTFLGIVIALLPDDVKGPLWHYSYTTPVWIPATIATALFGVSIWFLNSFVYGERQKRLRLEKDLKRVQEDLDRELKTSDRLRFRDVTTGLPNQTKLQVDFERLAKRSDQIGRVQLVMLDLEGFGEINNQFGYEKGDEVLRYVASSMYNTMRRDEDLYKLPPDIELHRGGILNRLYRKYSGGDEFLVILNGEEGAALGFLVRLKERFEGELTDKISKEILRHSWPLGFHAGVCPLDVGDSYMDAMDRVEHCLGAAKQKGSTCRVFWFSRKTAVDFPAGSRAAQDYSRAQKAFCCQGADPDPVDQTMKKRDDGQR